MTHTDFFLSKFVIFQSFFPNRSTLIITHYLITCSTAPVVFTIQIFQLIKSCQRGHTNAKLAVHLVAKVKGPLVCSENFSNTWLLREALPWSTKKFNRRNIQFHLCFFFMLVVFISGASFEKSFTFVFVFCPNGYAAAFGFFCELF